MAGLGPDIVADVVVACGKGAVTAGEVLGKALDTTIELSVGEPAQYDAAAPPEGFEGAGLIVAIREEGVGAALVIPTSSGLVPEWCAEPTEDQQSKLAALAEGIGEPLFDESVSVDHFEAAHVANIGAALSQAALAADAPLLPLELKADGDRTATAMLLWPLAKPGEIYKSADEETSAESPSVRGELPPYMKSLLRIKIPVSATLASSKQKVSDITSLSPGTIIQFDKGCDELLELYAGGQLIARGEAVKVGDLFGLQIKQIEMPEERFEALRQA